MITETVKTVWLTTKEAAERLGFTSDQQAQKCCRHGVLDCKNVGTAKRIRWAIRGDGPRGVETLIASGKLGEFHRMVRSLPSWPDDPAIAEPPPANGAAPEQAPIVFSDEISAALQRRMTEQDATLRMLAAVLDRLVDLLAEPPPRSPLATDLDDMRL